MGSELLARGIKLRNAAEANLTHPDVVAEIHRGYQQVGAQVFQTNTFAANPVMLERVGLGQQGPEMWAAAVRICREAVGPDAFVAANLGPTGELLKPLGTLSADEARSAFRQQLEVMLDLTVDLVLLESFEDLEELGLAIEQTRALDPRIPIAATLCFTTPNGRTRMGVDGAAAAEFLGQWDVPIIGANCGTPEALEAGFAAMSDAADRPLMAQPNAGLPQLVNGRTVWSGSPGEMGELAARLIAAGARIVGGCCGSTPQHILQVARAAGAGA
jgi:methionine synthase I (cobalamin-dependent)